MTLLRPLRRAICRAFFFGACAFCALGLWTGCNREPAARIPTVDLSRFDAGVSASIEKKLAAVRANLRSAETWGQLALILHAYDLYAAALPCFAEAERLAPDNPRWPYFQGMLLIVEDSRKSLAKLRRTVALCGNEPEAPRLRLALLLAESGDWPSAETESRALLQSKPTFAPALLLAARAAHARGDSATAEELARRCLDNPFTARSARIFTANLCLRRGDKAAADALLAPVPRLPSDAPLGDPFLAESAALRRDPRKLAELAHPLLSSGRLADAEPLIQSLITQYPAFPEGWLLEGRMRLVRKEFPRAEQAFQKHLQLDPASSQGFFQLGLLQLSQNRLPEAAQSFRKAIDLKPEFGAACYNLGLALIRGGNVRDAAACFEDSARFNPERVDPILMLAEIAIRANNKEAAAKWLARAESLAAGHPALAPLREREQRLRPPQE